MAEVHGVAGEWARVKGTVSGLWPLFLAVFAAGFSFAALLFFEMWVGLTALIFSLGCAGWCLNKGLHLVERFFKGARGEEKVSGILQGLPDTYHIFNDFVACGRHVDHVIVGPAGVFAVETKFWRGMVTVEEGHVLLDGQLPDRSPLAQARKEADAVKAALAAAGWSGAVTPVLTFASDSFVQHVAELQGTVIINSCELRRSFSTERVVIPPAELDRLVKIMESRS